MAYNRKQAETLCTKTEYDFFESSMKGSIEKLPQKKVQDGIKRARTLRDKYRDLHKRQRLKTQDLTGSKKGVKPASNARTEDKAKLFAEVLQRFEDRLKLLKQQEKAAAAESRKSAKKATKKKATKKKVAEKKVAKKKVAKKPAAAKPTSKKKAAKKVAQKLATEKAATKKAATKKAATRKVSANKATAKTAAKSATALGEVAAEGQRKQTGRSGGKKT